MSPTGGDTHTRKRQRVSQACHRCRSRKYRCDGTRPRCSACVAVNGNECVYEASNKRRGLTSGYVRALESLWALAFERIPGSRSGVQDLLSHLSATISDATPDHRAEREEELSRVWRHSGVPSAIESLLTGRPIEAVQGDSQDRTAETRISWALPTACVPTLPAASNDFTFASTEVYIPPSPVSSALPLSVPALSAAAIQQSPANPIFDPSSSGPHAHKLLPLPEDWLELVQVYLGAEHIWLPVLQRSALFKAASSYQDHIDACLQPSPSEQAEFSYLWAVLVLGEIHAHKASSSRLPTFHEMSRCFVERDGLFSEVNMLDHPLRHALVYILWTVTYMGQKRLFKAKLALSQAMVLATIEDSSIAGVISGAWPSRPIVSTACFVLDTILSLGMNTKPMLTNSDLQLDLRPLDEESSDEWEPFVPSSIQNQERNDINCSNRRAIPNRTCSTFNRLLDTVRILNDLLHNKRGHSPHSRSLPGVPSPHEIQNLSALARQSPAQLHLRLVQLVLYDVSTPGVPPSSAATSGSAASDWIQEQTIALLMHMKNHIGLELMPASLSAFVSQWTSTSSRLHTTARNTPTRGVFEDLGKVWVSDKDNPPGSTCSVFGAARNQALADFFEHQGMLYGSSTVVANFGDGLTGSRQENSTSGHLGNQTGTVNAAAENVSIEVRDPHIPTDNNRPTDQISGDLHNNDANESFMQVDPFDDYIALVDSNENSTSADFLASLGFLSEETFAGA